MTGSPVTNTFPSATFAAWSASMGTFTAGTSAAAGIYLSAV